MRRRALITALAAVAAVATIAVTAPTVSAQAAKVTAATPEAAGKYLLIVGSCHDCHTPGWTESKGKVAEDDYMIGNPVGYKGPWGTSYGKNLRTIAARQSEDHWVDVLKTADGGDGKLPVAQAKGIGFDGARTVSLCRATYRPAPCEAEDAAAAKSIVDAKVIAASRSAVTIAQKIDH